MRTFVFSAAGSCYALDASAIQAVHPLVRARPVAGTPPWLAGVIDVHGELVPMVDATMLLAGRPVDRTVGARVLLVDTGIGDDGPRARFALAVDRVLDAVDLEREGGWSAAAGAVPWLGAVLQHAGEAVQLFDAMALAGTHPQLSAPTGGALAEGRP
jgi:chemotaxis-related protein WspB